MGKLLLRIAKKGEGISRRLSCSFKWHLRDRLLFGTVFGVDVEDGGAEGEIVSASTEVLQGGSATVFMVPNRKRFVL